MIKRIRYFVLCGLIAVVACFTDCTPRTQETVTIYGSTTIEPITRKIAESYMETRAVTVSVVSNGSHDGIRALIKGDCDIADSSAKISPVEMDSAGSNGVNIKEFPFARDLVVPIVHADNPVKNLTIAQLRSIFSGEVNNWKNFGGADEAIDVVIRNNDSGTHDVWNRIILQGRKDAAGATLHTSNSSVLAYVAAHKNAVGYVSYAFLNSDVKALTVNGIRADASEGVNGTYPVSRTLYMYVNKKKLSENARGFIVYILSNEGQRIVRESGFIPLTGFSRH